MTITSPGNGVSIYLKTAAVGCNLWWQPAGLCLRYSPWGFR